MGRPEGLADAARIVQARSARSLSWKPTWLPLHMPNDERPEVAAVDGSHAVLVDNGAMWVVAVRATAVHWPGQPQDVSVEVTAVGPEDADAWLDGQYSRHGLEAPKVRGAEGFAEAVRRLREFEATLQGLEPMPAGALMLIDGALERLPRHATDLMDRILEAAQRRGIRVAAVAKKSRLDADGVPLVMSLKALAKQECNHPTWAVPVPGHNMAHIAMLHGQANHAFRVDVTDPDILHDLLPLCRDAVYTGYPYPLALAHNAVAISHAQARNLLDRLGDEVRAQGGEAAWSLLGDFHDILDRNAPRL
ncbi:MAG: DNA double-strand break repair nuclease NurA [Thermoplasmatota archaeon]